ncbi:aldo/keto reductase [Fructilactobacillus fructivorans]|uniref:Aldo/keto reductase n=1 Tax=Fructilactobacillus fructivorans TaxID=1614 RepID=A0A0C1PPF4_9LACO|nr:aldo/keto reductase [Fructilactobacillus fructivorans]KID41761.1 oxidoreductase, aldo/keto reductase family [Fructilactobacillus fructivorans]KRK58841.1 2,5-didehydrogluconate reductase [Fructilactobacillus fructivorans]KRN13752.1 2,5-didehydrogluconate reductase [Fructilactobacillus fructivorans]KRN39546.1 2,5-didehydrogluconate reductase [Fructilactobacillus fructivorans]MCT0151940.1 aldo/keto reductase [Fructilactobacillus fructivorans]
MTARDETFTLNNGIKIPQIFFGTYEIPARDTEKSVDQALKDGYPGIDTARDYGNEREVGNAIKNSDIDRDDIFLTTKIESPESYDEATKMIDEALEKLQTDYIDLMLYHWPSGDLTETYRAMEDAVKAGKLKSIGLSNFYGDDLDKILKNATIAPVVDQVETNVFRQQKDFLPVAKKDNLRLEAWSPFARGRNGFFTNETLKKIAQDHNKTVGQVGLRFLIQNGIIVLPRSTKPDRIKSNLDIFNFELSPDEMAEIGKLDTEKSQFGWL